MSHVPLALKAAVRRQRSSGSSRRTPRARWRRLQKVTPADFDLPIHGWANRQSGRSMGEHTEDTAKTFAIPRADQDKRALLSHQGAIAGQDSGFFKDLVIAVRRRRSRHDSAARHLAGKARGAAAGFRSHGQGTLTAGNSSPNTDGAASIWVADAEGLKRLGNPPAVSLVDWEIAAMDYHEEGILMAPARAIPRLLARNKLHFKDIDLGTSTRRSRRRCWPISRRRPIRPIGARKPGRFRSWRISVGPGEPAWRIARHRPSLCRDRRAYPEPGGERIGRDGARFARRRVRLRRWRPRHGRVAGACLEWKTAPRAGPSPFASSIIIWACRSRTGMRR